MRERSDMAKALHPSSCSIDFRLTSGVRCKKVCLALKMSRLMGLVVKPNLEESLMLQADLFENLGSFSSELLSI